MTSIIQIPSGRSKTKKRIKTRSFLPPPNQFVTIMPPEPLTLSPCCHPKPKTTVYCQPKTRKDEKKKGMLYLVTRGPSSFPKHCSRVLSKWLRQLVWNKCGIFASRLSSLHTSVSRKNLERRLIDPTNHLGQIQFRIDSGNLRCANGPNQRLLGKLRNPVLGWRLLISRLLTV